MTTNDIDQNDASEPEGGEERRRLLIAGIAAAHEEIADAIARAVEEAIAHAIAAPTIDHIDPAELTLGELAQLLHGEPKIAAVRAKLAVASSGAAADADDDDADDDDAESDDDADDDDADDDDADDDDAESDDPDCSHCGGSGGGDDAALRCAHCRGTGMAGYPARLAWSRREDL